MNLYGLQWKITTARRFNVAGEVSELPRGGSSQNLNCGFDGNGKVKFIELYQLNLKVESCAASVKAGLIKGRGALAFAVARKTRV